LLEDDEKLSLLKDTKHLYLREICEPRDNSLRLVVQEAVLNYAKAGSQLEAEGFPSRVLQETGILGNAHPIESTDTCRTLELCWKHYVAYLVTEECVGGCGEYTDEAYTGKLLRRYSKSHFLEHLARDTGGHMRPLQHYKLICLNHLIDVASEEPPEIQVISDESQVHDSVH
jgi:hypothetical protein